MSFKAGNGLQGGKKRLLHQIFGMRTVPNMLSGITVQKISVLIEPCSTVDFHLRQTFMIGLPYCFRSTSAHAQKSLVYSKSWSIASE
jgi:hypothetical protein